MRVKKFLILSSLLLLSGAWAADSLAPASGVTLRDCFERAKRTSETIGISAANTRALQEQYRTEIAAVLPHIDWIKSQFYQENVSSGDSGVGGSLLRTTQPESYFQIVQPIFAGFRDWDTVAIAKSQIQQARLNQIQTDLQLLSDVSIAFYSAYTLQNQLSVLLEIRKFNQNQVDLLTHWVNIGRSRPSDLLSAQTQLASVDAQIEDTKRTLAESRHLLYFQTGVPDNVPLIEKDPQPPFVTIDEALMRSGKRPDLMSAAEALNQADLAIRFARGGHLPTLGLTAHSYTERVGFLSDVRWDATFLLDVPLFEGGGTQAQIEQARAQEIVAQLTLARLKRDVDRQVRTAYDDLTHAYAEAQSYDKAVELADKNFRVQQKEYRLGVTSNLELLQLLTNMQNIRLQWLVSRANARLDDIMLRIAMGDTL